MSDLDKALVRARELLNLPPERLRGPSGYHYEEIAVKIAAALRPLMEALEYYADEENGFEEWTGKAKVYERARNALKGTHE